jgi:hypothetical protein
MSRYIEYSGLELPEVGQTYYAYDDGKVRKSRECQVTIDCYINPCDAGIKLIKAWQEEVHNAYFLYNRWTDYFVRAFIAGTETPVYFVRTLDGSWFSIPYEEENSECDLLLDIDGSLHNSIVNGETW